MESCQPSPDPKTLARAEKLGTLDQDDRSRQYPIKSQKELIDAHNKLWTKHRECERKLAERDAKVVELKRRLGNLGVKFWVLGLVVLMQWGVIGFLASRLK